MFNLVQVITERMRTGVPVSGRKGERVTAESGVGDGGDQAAGHAGWPAGPAALAALSAGPRRLLPRTPACRDSFRAIRPRLPIGERCDHPLTARRRL